MGILKTTASGASSSMANDRQPRTSVRRFLPLAIILGGLVLVFATGLHRYISWSTLEQNHEALRKLVAANAILAGVAFTALYAVVVALSVPGAAIMTIVGGFLFVVLWGTLLVVTGATLGATAIFLAARTALGDILRSKAGPWLNRLDAGFLEDGFSYLLVLRLVPLFPFFIVNVVPAFLGVPLRTYVLATFFGIIPGTLVYASVGNGLGALIEQGQRPDLGIIFDPEILLPILGLALLALIPVAYKRMLGRRSAS